MEKKKQRIYAVIALVTLALLVVGATYAYFQNQYGESSQTDVKVTTYTTDLLTFETGENISMDISLDNFASGTGNVVGETFAQANLKANNKTNIATNTYNLYLYIEKNKLKYTTEDGKTELLLQVTDPNGNDISTIEGLNYVTVTDGNGESLSGFDITTYVGYVTIVNNYEINSSSSSEVTSQKWIIKTTFVNYNSDQTENGGKEIDGKVIIQKEEYQLPTLAEYVMSQYTGIQGENNMYYHDNTLEYGAEDNSYRYAGGYILTDKAKKLGFKQVISDENSILGVINYFCNDIQSDSLTDCSGSEYWKLQYDKTNTKYDTFGGAEIKAKEDGYVEEINNWLCTGTGEDCSYKLRILGVFNDNAHNVKGKQLVRVLSFRTGGSGFKFSDTGSNEWDNSNIKTIINSEDFCKVILDLNLDLLENVSWKYNGFSNISVNAKSIYEKEIKSSINATEKGKISLIYLSDYIYSTSSNYWSINLSDFNYRIDNYNWMLSKVSAGAGSWTITQNSDNDTEVWGILRTEDSLNIDSVSVTENLSIILTFYLNSSVKYQSGDGSIDNPIRISVN